MKYSEEFYEFYRNNFPKENMTDENTLIAFDTNALLNIFRLTPKVSKKYFETIKKEKKRLYIPYLVALEFHFHKKEILLSNSKTANSVRKRFEKNWEKIASNAAKDFFSEFSFRNNDKELEKELTEKIQSALGIDENRIKKETLEQIDKIVSDQRAIYSELIEVMEGKTGSKYTQKEISEIEKEGEIRFKKLIPPGFDDSQKKGFRKYNGFEYQKKFGDLIIWKDLLQKSKDKNIEYVIFVTSDGKSKKKKDFLYKIGSEIIGPKVELIQEMKQNSHADFFIIDELKFTNEFSSIKLTKEDKKKFEDTLSQSISQLSNSQISSSLKEIAGSAVKSISGITPKRIKNKADLEQLLEESQELFSELLGFYIYLYSTIDSFINVYGETGWGEVETIQIDNVQVTDIEFGYDTISGFAIIDCSIEYSIVTKNHDWEEGEKEFFHDCGYENSVETNIEFVYYRSSNKLEFKIL